MSVTALCVPRKQRDKTSLSLSLSIYPSINPSIYPSTQGGGEQQSQRHGTPFAQLEMQCFASSKVEGESSW